MYFLSFFICSSFLSGCSAGKDSRRIGPSGDQRRNSVFSVFTPDAGGTVLYGNDTISIDASDFRIIDVFPPNQQHQIAVQLSMVLNAVVSQQLVPTVDGKMVPAFEVMTVTSAIRNMIRDNKVHQIDGIIYSYAKEEMISMDSSLLRLYKDSIISRDTALTYVSNPEMLERKLR